MLMRPGVYDSLRYGIIALWQSTPALGALLPLALGIYLGYRDHSTSWLLPMLCCGLALLYIGTYLRPRGASQIRSVRLCTRSYRLGVMLCLMALGGARVWLDAPSERSPSELRVTQRYLIEGLEHQGVSTEVAHLVGAISLGYTERGDATMASIREDFARSGMAHILAVSGYHLGLIVGLFAWLLRPLSGRRVGRLVYILLLTAIAWGFTALTGWGIPTRRAALMATLILLAGLLDRPVSLASVLASSACIQLLLTPEVLFARGMWLSYIAVLSIALYARPLFGIMGPLPEGGWHRVVRYLWGVLTITLAVQVLTLPLCLHLFGYVSWSFILTALPMALLSAVVIPLGLLSLGMTALSLELGGVASVLEVLGQAMLRTARVGSLSEGFVLYGTLPRWGLVVLWLMALLPMLYGYGRRLLMR